MTTPQRASRHRCGPVSVLSTWPEPVALPTKEAPRQEARSMDLTDLTSTDTEPASPAPPPGLVAGVDTHQDTHTLAVLTAQGAVIATSSTPPLSPAASSSSRTFSSAWPRTRPTSSTSPSFQASCPTSTKAYESGKPPNHPSTWRAFLHEAPKTLRGHLDMRHPVAAPSQSVSWTGTRPVAHEDGADRHPGDRPRYRGLRRRRYFTATKTLSATRPGLTARTPFWALADDVVRRQP